MKTDQPYKLTDRELQVISLASHGKSNEQIAQALGVEKETIKSHVKNARRKLQASNCTQAVAKCLRFGMIE
jgi:DNA-binding CsgD family transcriptional regulator